MKCRPSTAAALGLLVIWFSACSRPEGAPQQAQEEHPELESSADSARPGASHSAGERVDRLPGAEPRELATDTPARGVSPPDTKRQERLAGRVVVTGSQPMVFTTLQLDGGRSVNLAGPLAAELRRLSGGVVTVTGVPTTGMPGGGIEVHDYEVTSIDGQRPEVGELVVRDGEVWLVGSDTLRLSPPLPEELNSRPGAKVWIIGSRSDGALRVQSYGVIRGG